MRIILFTFICLSVSAATIPPPDLTIECDGRQHDAHCITGTIVRFQNGWPVTEMLKPTPEHAPVEIAAVPEPSTLLIILGLAGMLILVKLIGPEIRKPNGGDEDDA